MKFASTGTRERSQSSPADRDRGRAGYLLLEALVALALLLAFAAVLGPVLFQARRIMGDADNRVAAQALLRSLIDAPLDRSAFANDVRQGNTADLHWRISATPMRLDSLSGLRVDKLSSQQQPQLQQQQQPQQQQPQQQQPSWTAYRVVASVSWGEDHTVTAETVRLGKAQ